MELTIQAGAKSFGDGQHPSTIGMLTALEALDPTQFTPRNVLDMGAGSGILSIAAARQFGAQVLAVDIEVQALDVLRENAKINSVDNLIVTLHADGFKHPQIAACAPYDLVLMNILAEPLIAMAADAVPCLAAGGVLLMAGLLKWQEPQIIDAYQQLDVELMHRLTLGDWVALAWGKPLS